MRYPGYLSYKLEIPEGVDVKIENIGYSKWKVIVKGPKGTLEREFFYHNVWFEKEGNVLYVKSYWPSRKEKRIMKTWLAHVKNMIKGVTEGYEYRLKIVYRHFPLKVELKGNKLYIKNYLGMKDVLEAEILPGVKVEIKGQDIIVTGIDKEKVGQTAANIEQACLRAAVDKDKRKFFDGIYIYKKGDKWLVNPEEVGE